MSTTCKDTSWTPHTAVSLSSHHMIYMWKALEKRQKAVIIIISEFSLVSFKKLTIKRFSYPQPHCHKTSYIQNSCRITISHMVVKDFIHHWNFWNHISIFWVQLMPASFSLCQYHLALISAYNTYVPQNDPLQTLLWENIKNVYLGEPDVFIVQFIQFPYIVFIQRSKLEYHKFLVWKAAKENRHACKWLACKMSSVNTHSEQTQKSMLPVCFSAQQTHYLGCD